jgi:peptidoglycan/xylan/chitin deacetylase (PgdA/CDA1 family)
MSQLQNTMYRDTPAIVRDVSATQFAAQRVNAPDQPGVIYRVDGALYSWNGSAWVGQVTAQTDPVTGGVSLVAGGQPVSLVSQPRHHVIREFNTLQDVTNSATGGTVTPTIDTASPFGGRALKLAFGASVTQHDLTISGFNLADFTSGRAKLVAVAMFEEPRAISQVQCFVGTDTGFGTSMRCDHRLANSGLHHSHSFQSIVLTPELAAVNSLTATSDCTAFRLRFQRSGTPITNGIHNLPGDVAASAYVTNVWIKGIYIVRNTLPFVVLTFDDASRSWMTYLQPLLATRGLKATFGVNQNDVGTNDSLFINETDLNALSAYGHDIASHNQTNTSFTIATIGAYLTGFRACRDWHYNAGRRSRLDYHPYIQGVFNPDLSAAIAAEGVKWARTVNDMNFERPLWDYGYHMQMPSRSLGNVNNLAAAQGWVTQAQARQQDVIVMGHEFAPTAANSTTWAASDMASFLDFCLSEKSAGRIAGVGSLTEYINHIGF